jgi:hypothetical protein
MSAKKSLETLETLEVHATRDGFYGEYRRAGATFTIKNPAKSFSKRWMVEADTASGAEYARRHAAQTNAARDAITGERLQSGGQAEEILVLQRQLAELAAHLQTLDGPASAERTQVAGTPAPTATVNAPAEAVNHDEHNAAAPSATPALTPTTPATDTDGVTSAPTVPKEGRRRRTPVASAK